MLSSNTFKHQIRFQGLSRALKSGKFLFKNSGRPVTQPTVITRKHSAVVTSCSDSVLFFSGLTLLLLSKKSATVSATSPCSRSSIISSRSVSKMMLKHLTSCLSCRLYTALITPGNSSFSSRKTSPWKPPVNNASQ